MPFGAPAAVDDLADLPELREKFVELWNDNGENGYLGRYVAGAARRSRNYVDPRQEPPVSDAVKIPWNGFPRGLSRWFDDEQSSANKERAEAAADVATPILSWVEPIGGELGLREAEEHRLPFFGPQAQALARPLRRILPSGALGPEVLRERRQQDEYLEWHASRDAAGRLVALTFTAEPPDYWAALAEVAPDRVFKLYQQLVGPEVEKDDLFHSTDLAVFGLDLEGTPQWFALPRKGTYEPLNIWTTTRGIVHLTHRANTLGAEVTLAADSSLVWGSDSQPPPVGPGAPNPEILRVACGGYGGINRSSDPLIGLGVGRAVKGGARVTLADPIGLYIGNADIGGLLGPQGQPVGKQALSILRGQDDPFDPRILRFEVRLPVGTPFGLDDCTLDGRKLARGGQVARVTTMQIYAQTYPTGADVNPVACEGRACRHPERAEVFTIGAPNLATPCPGTANSRWLLETPFEGIPAIPAPGAAVGPPAVPAMEAHEAAGVKAKLAIAPTLPTSRAPAKD